MNLLTYLCLDVTFYKQVKRETCLQTSSKMKRTSALFITSQTIRQTNRNRKFDPIINLRRLKTADPMHALPYKPDLQQFLE